MTRSRGRPRPQGIFKNFGQKNFGLNFRSLNQESSVALQWLLQHSKLKVPEDLFETVWDFGPGGPRDSYDWQIMSPPKQHRALAPSAPSESLALAARSHPTPLCSKTKLVCVFFAEKLKSP